MQGCQSEFNLQPVHPDSIDKIISSLKNTSSYGLDNIDTRILKLIKSEVVPPITHIVNLSISEAVYPKLYKISKIIPLYKGKGDIMEPGNFRPVALLPIISKCIERAVYQQIVKYMEDSGYFHPNHHGFRSNHSTATAMLQMYDSWVEAVDKKEIAGAVLIDMSAAFDVVDSDLLLAKLELYGFSRHARQWVWSYMTDRSQVVCLEGALSSSLRVSVGVPQGSILGPLLYIIFTNELPEVIHQEVCLAQQSEGVRDRPVMSTGCLQCGSLVCYADDSTYCTSDPDPQNLSRKLSEQYSRLAKFLGANRLKVNDDKTHTLVLTTSQLRRKRANMNILVEIGGELSEPSEVERLLGALHSRVCHKYLK